MPPLPSYVPLPKSDSKIQQEQRTIRTKTALFRLLAVLTTMFFAYQGLKTFSSSSMAFLRTGIRPCHSIVNGTATRNVSTLPTHYTLPSGDKIPSVALGVWKAGKGEVGQAVKHALKTGYRHIDGAWIYGNEAEVGQAIKESGVKRTDIFITSKLWNTFHAPEDVEAALDESLSRLDTEFLDLYLIHWPVAQKKGTSELDESLTEDVYPTWKKLEELVDKGKVRNIGVSNFNIARVKNLTANPLKHRPAVNQVELSFWNPQPDLIKWAKENDLLLEAYSPLGGVGQVGKSLKVPEVQSIAEELGITPAQVIISWLAQRGAIVLPKSVTPSRIEENLKIHALPTDLFEKLERAAEAHPPFRTINPSKNLGLSYDLFDESWPFNK
ncbi:NADP-dependent oxidoreductase domain-containing protein [Cytidiella melzeri]|nr:NADP-dependent oxidoreductase domain-containing protein [Cytidiella melzeri]